MALTVADLLAKLSLDTSGFRKGAEEAAAASQKMEGAANKASEATGKTEDSNKKAGKSFGDLAQSLNDTTQKFTDLLTPANLFGTVIGVTVVGALKSAVDHAFEFTSELRRLSLVTGDSLGRVAEFQGAVDKLGVGSDKLSRAFFFLSTEMENGGANLAKLGIELHTAEGYEKSIIDITQEMSDKFRAMGAGADVAAAARKILGRQAIDMLPVFQLEREQIRQLGEEEKRFSEQIGTDGLTAMTRFRGSLMEIGGAVTRVQTLLVLDLAPGFKMVADFTSAAVDSLLKVPAPVRHIGEALAALTVSLIAATLATKAFAAALELAGLASWATGVGTAINVIRLLVAGLVLFITLGPMVKDALVAILPQSVIDAWQSFSGMIGSAYQAMKNFIGLGPKEVLGPPAELATKKYEPTLADEQKRLQYTQQLTAAQIALGQATMTSEAAQVNAIKLTLKQRLDELAVQARFDTTPTNLARTAALRTAAEKTASAQIAQITQQANLQLLTIEEQTAEQRLAIEGKSRDAMLAARIDEIAQTKKLVADEYAAFGVSQAGYIAETIRLNGLELTAKQTAITQEMTQVKAAQQLKALLIGQQISAHLTTQAKADEELAKLQVETDAKLLDLTTKAETMKREVTNQNRELGKKAIQDELIFVAQAENRDLALKLANLETYKRHHADQVNVVVAATAEGYRLLKAAYDKDVQNYIDAQLSETGILKNETAKRVAQEAGLINALKQLRQQSIDNQATVLEQQARQAGDLGAAYQVGFAHAASSADDAFAAMRKAGTDTYQVLKSGVSDFLFDTFTRAKSFGEAFTHLFVDMGKRIVRTMTDAFAEIIVRQTLMAAGFSLPAVVGTAGTAIAATAGFEGVPNQAATAVQHLGDSATTAGQALGGVGQVSALLSATFGSLGTLLMTFGSAILGVIKLLASIGSFGAAGSIGSTAGNVLGTITSLGSAFGNFTSLIQGSLTNTIQNIFTSLGAGEGGIFGTAAGSFGPGFAPGIGASLLGKAIPIAGGLISIGLDFLHGNIAGGIGGALGGGIGAIFGGPVGFGIGSAIGSFIGNLIGGLFSGPTPEISGKVQLNSTNIQALLAATRAVPFSSGPGPNQVNNPPGRSNFSFLDTGPLHQEMFLHRTQGTLSREESQIEIQNVILATLQAAVKGLSQLGPKLPTEALSKALSTRIDAVLTKGFDIANFDFEGDVEEVVKNFQDFLKGLSGQALTAFTTELFPSIDLTALGAGDAAKGFDVLASSLAGFSNLLVKSGHATAFAEDSIDRFATRSIDFFAQFKKDGEVLADTITRVSQQIGQMIDQLDAFHVSTDQFLLGLQTRISTLSLQSGGGLGEFNLLRDVAPGIIGAFSRDVQLQFLSPLIASLKEQALGAIEANAPIGDVLAGRQQVVSFGVGLFQSLQGEADPVKAIQGLQLLAKGAEDLLAGEIEGAKAYYAQQIALARSAADARIAQLEAEKQTIQLNTSAIEAQITAAEAHISQLEAEKRGIEESTKGIEDQIRALEAIGQARIAPLQEEQRLLQDQLSTLQQQAQAIQAWKGVLDSVTKQLTDMRLTTANPQNALERLNIAQQLVTQAKAKFAAEGTPEAATALQQALGDELKIAQDAFQRPSAAYQHIFDQVSADLQAIQSVAGAHAADLEGLTQEIATRQARIEVLNQQIKEIEQQTRDAVHPLQVQLDALKAINAARLQEIATEEAQIQASVQPLREQLQAMKAEAATRLHAIESEEVQVRATLQTTIAGLMSQQDATIQSFREEATGWLKAIRNEAMVRLEQAVREGDAEIARLLGLPPPLDPRFAQASQGLMSLAQLAQGGGLPDIAASLASSSQALGQGHLPDALTAMMRGLAQAQGSPALQGGTGPEIISRFAAIIRDTQAGLYDPALASLNSLVQWLRSTGITGAPVPGFAAGIDYVPRDEFPARLHHGERVLTAEENRVYSSGRGGDVTIHFAPTVQIEMTGSEPPDVLRRKLDEATATLLVTPSRTRAALVRFAREHA